MNLERELEEVTHFVEVVCGNEQRARAAKYISPASQRPSFFCHTRVGLLERRRGSVVVVVVVKKKERDPREEEGLLLTSSVKSAEGKKEEEK